MGKASKAAFIPFVLAVIASVLLFVYPLTAFADQEASANQENSQTRTVRVGYAIMTGFQDGQEDEYKSGQGYEYLQKIASYAGWDYEYVYGDFGELYEQLAAGEIDLMGDVTFSDERTDEISFASNEQGRETFYLYARSENDSIDANNLSTLEGKKIGALSGTYQIEAWDSWCRKNGVDCELVEYQELEKGEDALNKGEVDAFLGVTMPAADKATADWVIVLPYGNAPYYFAVSKSQPQILEELNAAQNSILESNPYYNEELIARYAANGVQSRLQLNGAEKEWLSQHDGALKVGVMDDFQPLSKKDSLGNIEGVIPDLLSAIQNTYSSEGLQFELVMYSDAHQIMEDLNSGQIDIAAPVYNDPYSAERFDISLTNPFLTTTMLQLFENSHAGEPVNTIAINEDCPFERIYAEIYYPDCELLSYHSDDETAEAVKHGEADAALSTACCYHVNAILNEDIGKLGRSTLPNKVDLSMAVSRNNPQLMSLLNRGIAATSEAVVNDSLAVNSSVVSRVTLGDYLVSNPVTAIAVISAVCLLLLLIIFRLRRANLRARTDGMTGLLNKVAMHEHVKGEISHGGVLFIIDIDNFKDINDTLGHQAGDEVISYFAQGKRQNHRVFTC